MRKFDVTKGTRGRRHDRAGYRGETWMVVDTAGRGRYRHLYYALRKPYKRQVAHEVRSDLLDVV